METVPYVIMYVFVSLYIHAYMYVMVLVLTSFSVEGQVSRSIRCMSGGSGMPQSFTLRGRLGQESH